MKLPPLAFLSIELALCWTLRAQELGGAAGVSSAALRTLRSIAEIHALSTEEAARGYPVRLQAVVTYHNSRRYCFAEDGTGAIYIMRQQQRFDLEPGQIVQVEGITEPGLYATEILEQRATVLGAAPLKPPPFVTIAELLTGKFHCQRVCVEGVVRMVDGRWNDGRRLDLQIATSDGRIEANIFDIPNTRSYDYLLDAKIRLTGVAAGKFNARREFVRPTIEVEGLESLEVESAGPSNPFALPIRAVATLLRYSAIEPDGKRTRVRGAVTYQEPGKALFLQDETGGLQVKAQSAEVLSIGDLVDAAGLPLMGAYSPLLQDAVFRRVEAGPPPPPRPVSSADALSGRFDAELVTMRAELLNSMRRGPEAVLILKADGVIFEAPLRQPANEIQDPNSPRTINLPVRPARFSADLPPHGSLLELTGICSISEVREAGVVLAPRSFQLLLRSPADLTVVHGPPWWTPQRLVWTLSAMGAAILCGIGWVALLRQRVQQQTRIIRRRVHNEAVLQERHRMAREVHDTLVQGFAGISLQLEAVRGKLPPGTEVLDRHLEVAHALARGSLSEARRSIWALHNDALLTAGIAASLAASAKSIAGGAGIETRFEAAGDCTHLSAEVENNLLYIGREAILNAVKYASPHQIVIELGCTEKACRLRIRDDGCGFDMSKIAPEGMLGNGGFGMISMRERAQQIGATFTIHSETGAGTEITVAALLTGAGRLHED
jgi:signal transduction histidine kinase